MSYLIESWNVSERDKKAFRGAAIEIGLQRGLQLGLATGSEGLVVWGLASADFGLSRWTFDCQAGGEWLPWIQKHVIRIGDVVVITKISILFPLTPELNGIKFFVGPTKATPKVGFSLSQLYGIAPLLQAIQEKLTIDRLAGVREHLEGWPIMEGYFTEPIMYNPQDTIGIDLLCDSSTRIGVVLGGFIIRRMDEDIM